MNATGPGTPDAIVLILQIICLCYHRLRIFFAGDENVVGPFAPEALGSVTVPVQR